jgi:hypothetical protein
MRRISPAERQAGRKDGSSPVSATLTMMSTTGLAARPGTAVDPT